ncbi:MAG: NTP transferase domain-containing protein [Candidatus Delongbacteria bacterium]|nr:NTP transferase domain-containing protein [Candidatus Delongbacteria bacterium]MBN2835977.1 NTP transferase domain-containing protein [Candidatus Delongbacteria bacterium]
MKNKVVILAAGKGTRMKTDVPKVLVKVNDQTMISMVVDAYSSPENEIAIIVSPENIDAIKSELGNKCHEYIIQKDQLGTGHAVLCAENWLKDFDGNTLITVGDAPFISREIVKKLISVHEKSLAGCTFLTAKFVTPPPYGRVVRDNNGEIVKIVEEKDANSSELMINEVSTSHYCFHNKLLLKYLNRIDNNNSQNEYYLPDVIKLMIEDNIKIDSFTVDDPYSLYGINSLEDLDFCKKRFNQ